MEKKMENEMEVGIMWGFIGIGEDPKALNHPEPLLRCACECLSVILADAIKLKKALNVLRRE